MKPLYPLLALLALAACQRSEPTNASALAAQPAVAPSTPALTVNRVKGSWARLDGDYMLVIGEIADGGRADVRYFNPSPINVAWGSVKLDANAIQIQVELRDRNYPGCLYKLTYSPDKDQLIGTYFQAQMQQTYEVLFIRK